VLALSAEVLGHSDISLTPSDQARERKYSQNGTSNEADSGKTSELPCYKYGFFIYQIATGRS